MTMQPDHMKSLRKAAGMTQEKLAAEIGMTRKSINDMENGRAPIERRTELAIRYVTERQAVDSQSCPAQ